MVSRRSFLRLCAGGVGAVGGAGCLQTNLRVTDVSARVLEEVPDDIQEVGRPLLTVNQSNGRSNTEFRGVVYSELSCQSMISVPVARGDDKDIVLEITPATPSVEADIADCSVEIAPIAYEVLVEYTGDPLGYYVIHGGARKDTFELRV